MERVVQKYGGNRWPSYLTEMRGEGKRALLSKVSKRNRHIKRKKMSLNSAAEMRHRAMDCWNRDDQTEFGPFCASQNRKAGLCRGDDRRRPRIDQKENHGRRQKATGRQWASSGQKMGRDRSACRQTKDVSCLTARSLKSAVDSLVRPARCRVSST